MKKLPIDIELKINELFAQDVEKETVKEMMLNLWTESFNVGTEQLVRSILILSNGSLEEIKKIIRNFNGDPRDVIMAAENKVGNPGHFFLDPF
jgi:Glu-tRNA(Gln) amidotransferase subunit E-like FAD-binding protein